MSEKKGIAILGSTGSIGTQALEVIEAYPEYFDLQVITAGKNADLLIEQAFFSMKGFMFTPEKNHSVKW
jgi:1-deoxy-D-xylulose-5-phosphate reductoisomerase